MLQGLGFKALATTSSGHAWSHGQADGARRARRGAGALREIVAATDAAGERRLRERLRRRSGGVAESVRLAVETGVAGLSIEDSTGDANRRCATSTTPSSGMRAARAAIDDGGGDALLIGRAESFLAGRPDLDDTIARLKAYAEAGADCLYAPGIRTPSRSRPWSRRSRPSRSTC